MSFTLEMPLFQVLSVRGVAPFTLAEESSRKRMSKRVFNQCLNDKLWGGTQTCTIIFLAAVKPASQIFLDLSFIQITVINEKVLCLWEVVYQSDQTNNLVFWSRNHIFWDSPTLHAWMSLTYSVDKKYKMDVVLVLLSVSLKWDFCFFAAQTFLVKISLIYHTWNSASKNAWPQYWSEQSFMILWWPFVLQLHLKYMS